jgi:uncharacterized protein (DUF2235 family)
LVRKNAFGSIEPIAGLEVHMRSRAVFSFSIVLLQGAVAPIVAGPADDCRPRRLVVCLDGTQNSPEQVADASWNGHKLYKPTNVLKTFRAILPVGEDGMNQIAYYSEGVGSMIGEETGYARFEVLVDRIFGGATGVGYESRVKSAYRFLVANYKPGDQIVVFGFSRGAAEAQTLVRFIEWVGGILHKEGVGGLLHKSNEYWIPELYDNFKRYPRVPADKVFAEIRCRSRKESPPPPAAQRGWIYDPQEAQIEFLGVYDTVVSVGSRWAPDVQRKKYAYLVDKEPPTIVKKIRQALAIDERRSDFWPEIWQPQDPKPQQDDVKPLMQLWFPGVHSNVGGGYKDEELSNGALGWMIGEAEDIAHLAVDHDYYLRFYETDKDPCRDRRHDSYTFWQRIADFMRGKGGRGVRRLEKWDDQHGSWKRSGLGFHESLGTLLLCDCTYRPKILLEYLAKHQERIKDFPSHQCEIRQIVQAPNVCPPSPCEAAAALN